VTRPYDPKCHELAEYFLSDKTAVDRADIVDLAEHIQGAVEDWIYSCGDRLDVPEETA
jgi:hypothetical protein